MLDSKPQAYSSIESHFASSTKISEQSAARTSNAMIFFFPNSFDKTQLRKKVKKMFDNLLKLIYVELRNRGANISLSLFYKI